MRLGSEMELNAIKNEIIFLQIYTYFWKAALCPICPLITQLLANKT